MFGNYENLKRALGAIARLRQAGPSHGDSLGLQAERERIQKEIQSQPRKDGDTQLTANFWLSEFTFSATAIRYGIDNTPPEQAVRRLALLCESILQPARDMVSSMFPGVNVSIKVVSGYRSPRLNEKVGGSQSSFHLFGYAADVELYMDGQERNDVLFSVMKELPYTELVWEHGTDKAPAWVHVAYSEHDSRKMLKRRPAGLPIPEISLDNN